MDAESLYTLAKKYQFDEICLKILRNCNYTDETVILNHWKNIIDQITHSDNYNRMEIVRTKVITLAKEFNTDCIELMIVTLFIDSPCFFPLPYLFEIILSAGSLEMNTPSTLYKWFVSCFIQCGVSYEQLAKTGFDLIDLKSKFDPYCHPLDASYEQHRCRQLWLLHSDPLQYNPHLNPLRNLRKI